MNMKATADEWIELDLSYDLHGDSAWLSGILTEFNAETRWERSGQRFEGDPVTIVSIILAAKYLVDLVENIVRRSRNDVVIDLRKNALHIETKLSTRNGRVIVIDAKGEQSVHEPGAKDTLSAALISLMKHKSS